MDARPTSAEHRERAAQFRALAERATLPGLREWHHQLAAGYADAAARLEAAENAAAPDTKDGNAG